MSEPKEKASKIRVKTLLELQLTKDSPQKTAVIVDSPLYKILNRKWVAVEGLVAEIREKKKELIVPYPVKLGQNRGLDWVLGLLGVKEQKKETE